MTERNFTVYFEIFGKRMKTKVIAKSAEEAKQKVSSRLIFHKIEITPNDDFNKAIDMMNDLLNHFGDKK